MPGRVSATPNRVRASLLTLTVALGAGIAMPGLLVSPAGAQDAPPATTAPANPVAPGVETGAADAISTTTAGVTGVVNPGRADTTVFFEFRTTTAYGLATASQSVAASDAAVAVRSSLTGLTGATTYHYRVVAQNAAGVTRGVDRTFITAATAARPSIASVAATGVGPSGATLPARITPRGQTTTYLFEYGTAKTFGSQTPATELAAGAAAVAVSVPLTGLQPNTRYYYRAVATNATGKTLGRTRTFLTTRAVDGVSIKAGRTTVAWGGSTAVAGTVSGAGVGGVRVALMRQDFPFSKAPVEVAATITSAAGAYAFSVGPLYAATKLWVQTRGTPVAQSSALASIQSNLLVQLKAGSRTKTRATLRGLIYPRVTAARASLQRKTSTGRWVTISRPRLSHSTAANRSSFTTKVPRYKSATSFRLLVTPNDSGGHVKTTSTSLSVPKRG